MIFEFVIASLVLIALPGPDQALIMRNALVGGRPEEPEHEARGGRPFAQGFVSNALNPKVALFFLTFVPQFLPESGSTLPVALGLSAIFAAIYVAWFSGLISLVGLASDALRRPRVKAWIERVTGGA